MKKLKRKLRRLVRFTELFFHYIPHVWEASKFKHSFYIVHKTDSLEEHDAAKKSIDKAVSSHKPRKSKKLK